MLLGTFTAEKGWQAAGLPGERLFWRPMLMGTLAASAVILAAMYLLTMYQKIFFGPLDKPENRDPHVKDIHGKETWVFGTICLAALVMGVYPRPILERTEASVKAFSDELPEAAGRGLQEPRRRRPASTRRRRPAPRAPAAPAAPSGETPPAAPAAPAPAPGGGTP